MWASATLAMIEGKSKRETLNIPVDVWEQDDDPINVVMQERYRDMLLEQVMQTLRQNHERIVQKLNGMTEADLLLPYRHYQPQSSDERPIIDYVMWDIPNHYRQHIPWIRAIVEKA
jgi:hypothetical protein